MARAARVRFETDHAQRRVQLARGLGGKGDHLLVTAMHAVEIPQRHGRALVGLRQSLPVANDAHRPQATFRGTMTTASPSTTDLPFTAQTVARVAWPRVASKA